MDEAKRIALVESFHRRARIRLPNLTVHATLHTVVENQAALGDETPVQKTIERLIKEGIDRHEAIHAVAAVLTDLMSKALSGVSRPSDPNVPYFEALEKLTVDRWRRDFGAPSRPGRGQPFRR